MLLWMASLMKQSSPGFGNTMKHRSWLLEVETLQAVSSAFLVEAPGKFTKAAG